MYLSTLPAALMLSFRSSTTKLRAFDAHDRQLVQTLATQAAQALRNTWLMNGLNQVGQKALRSDQELCQTIVDFIYRLTRCPVAFWRVDPD